MERPEGLAPLLASTTITTTLTTGGKIQQVVEMRSNLSPTEYQTRILDLKEDQIRIALIALGWTPPEQK